MEMCGEVLGGGRFDPPSELLMPLLPNEKSFLAWAVKQVGGRRGQRVGGDGVWGIGWVTRGARRARGLKIQILSC